MDACKRNDAPCGRCFISGWSKINHNCHLQVSCQALQSASRSLIFRVSIISVFIPLEYFLERCDIDQPKLSLTKRRLQNHLCILLDSPDLRLPLLNPWCYYIAATP